MSGDAPTEPATGPAGRGPTTARWLAGLRHKVRARLFAGPDGGANEDRAEAVEPKEQTDDNPRRLGRFTILERLGSGGMGVVYVAYDDALDRRVAVKLLAGEGRGGGTDGRARLLREAQALARLTHPSVVHVYEVGEFDEQVYIAMEYVDGQTLQRWQAEDVRPWHEILAYYVVAGRGLAAAHEAGIVHRDFKPDNVLVRQGRMPLRDRIRVLDFGLARTDDRSPPAAASEPVEPSGDGNLTRTGTIMGTPAYMAPEQHLGLATDHRTDQFAFCVALFEALYGYRPFHGDALADLRGNVLGGHIEPPPPSSGVPGRVHRAILRGLRVEPSARWPSMTALLDELQRDPKVLSRKLAFGSMVALTVASFTGTVWWFDAEQAERGHGERLRWAFDRARRRGVEAELRRVRSSSRDDRWNDLVLAYADAHTATAPAHTLAALKHLSPDGSQGLAAARMIAADAITRIPVLAEHELPNGVDVTAAKFAGDAVVAATSASSVLVWRPVDGSAAIVALGRHRLVDVCGWDDGERFAAVASDGTLHLGSTIGAPPPKAIAVSNRPLHAVACDPTGSRVAVAGDDGDIRLFDAAGKPLSVLRGHRAPVEALAFAGSDRLASGGRDPSVRVWFIPRNTHWELDAGGPIRSLQAVEQTGTLAVVTDELKVTQWSLQSGGRPPSPVDEAMELAIDRSGRTTLSLSLNRRVELRRVDQGGPLRPIELLGGPLGPDAIALGDDGELALAVQRRKLVVWRVDSEDGRTTSDIVLRQLARARAVRTIVYLQDRSALAVGAEEGVIEIVGLDREESRGAVALASRTDVQGLRVAPDGARLLAWDRSGALGLVDVEASTVLDVLVPDSVVDAAWSPDGLDVLALQCKSEACELVRIELADDRRQVLGSARIDGGRLLLSSDGRRALTLHPRGVWWWDLERPTHHALLEDRTGPLVTAVFEAGSSAARIVMARPSAHDPDWLDLVVHRVGTSGIAHPLVEETELREIHAAVEGGALLLRDAVGGALLWSVDNDRFSVLPDHLGWIDTVHVSPDRDFVLLHSDRERFDRLVHVDSGFVRRLPVVGQPIAWLPDGVFVDVVGLDRIGLRQSGSPVTFEAFRGWLDEATRLEIDADLIR